MTFLIDTHTFLWFINGSNKLSKTAKEHLMSCDDIFDLYLQDTGVKRIW